MGKYQKNIEAARRISVMQYLQTYHPGELVRKTDKEYCTKTHSSLVITPANGLFHWFSQSKGGNNALDYLVKVEGMDFVSAVRLLSAMAPAPVSIQTAKASSPQRHTTRSFELPAADRNTEAATAYLMHRGISPKVLRYCVGSGILYGVMTPAIVRPRKDGGYEIVAGHRRCHASQRAGVETMPCIVRDMDDDTAIILMVDSNCQREHILPSEKAKAYEMKLEAIKRQGQRTDLTSGQLGQKLSRPISVEQVADDAGTSIKQVQRFIRLNKLTPELMKMVDDGKLKTTPAVELSYLTPEEQEDFLSYMESEGCTPSLSQAQKLKEASKESVLTSEKIQHIMAAKPPSVKPRDPQLMIPVAKVERYFPKGFTSDQMQQVIVKLLENYARAHQHGSR